MRTIPAPVAPVVVQLVLLGALLRAVGAGGAGVAVGIACAVLGGVVLAGALADHGRTRLGPADHVTVTRGTLACVVAALTTDSALAATPRAPLVLLATVALTMDAVDGWVARRTHTASTLGARLDMEVDAFLILVLSIAASGVLGWWVLAIGAFRYAFVALTWAMPWLGGAVAPRYSRKAVAALQGIVLTVAVAQVLPRGAVAASVVVALALLAWSFGTQTVELWRTRAARAHAPRTQPSGEWRTPALQRAEAADVDPGSPLVRFVP